MQSVFLKRAWAQINLDNLKNNYSVIRASLNPETKILAVVKANAYGHGDETVSRELEKMGADFFGVSNIEEALFLRKSGVTRPILIFGYTPAEFANVLSENEITQTVFSKEYAESLNEVALKNGVTVSTHVKIDSGMGRIGFRALNEVLECFKLKGLCVCGMFTHFAVADEKDIPEKDYTKKQFEFFSKIVDGVKQNGFDPGICHCSNSAGVLSYPEYQLDMVRPGIILYTDRASDGCVCDKLLDVMELKSTVAMVKKVNKGECVSYGCTFKAERETLVATAPVGYADGLPRSASNGGEVLILGKRAKIIGRVCMDQIMIDVTDIPNVKAGDVVTIFGKDQEEFISIQEFSKNDSTISYEKLCMVGKRVPRVYLSGGEIVKIDDFYGF